MNYQHWLSLAAARFTHSDSPKRDAEILLSFVTGKARTYLLAFGETEITAEQLLWLETLANRREQGEPIAYLVGEREFWSLPLSVSSATLIPRPDTECLVEQALARLPSMPCRILDLGTGTGAIALALASERRDCAVIAVDINADAVALARHNAKKLAIDNVCFLQGSWFEPVSGRFALIASNPLILMPMTLILMKAMCVMSRIVYWLRPLRGWPIWPRLSARHRATWNPAVGSC